MSRHLNAKKKDISKYILITGNPLRAKWAAEKFLDNYKLVSDNRGCYIYSGYYKNFFISFATSGMGMASMAIYAKELFEDYKAETIIRIGTSGGYSKNIKVYDIVNSIKTYTQSNIGLNIDYKDNFSEPSIPLYNMINKTAKELNMIIKQNKISHSNDYFYLNTNKLKKLSSKFNIELCEMESYILWIIAKKYNKHAATILLVVDLVINFEKNNQKIDTTFEERIFGTEKCWKLGIETLINFSKNKS